MARHFTGTDSVITAVIASPPTLGEIYWSVWWKPDFAADATNTTDVVRYHDLTVTGTCGYTWSAVSAAQRRSSYFVTAGPVVHSSQATSVLAAGVWRHIGGAFTTTGASPNTQATIVDSNRQAFITGLAAANSAGPSPRFVLQGATGGALAEFAAWINPASAGNNKVSTVGDQGLPMPNGIPSAVINQAGTNKPVLICYLPLIGYPTEPDLSGNGLNGVVTGTTIVPHPTSWGQTIINPCAA